VGQCDEYALRTHEVAYDSTRRVVWITQMVPSALLRFDLDDEGRMPATYTRLNDFGEWGGGRGGSAIHWVSMSKFYPGMVWVTLQNEGVLYLLNPDEGMRIVKEMHIPRNLTEACTGDQNVTGIRLKSEPGVDQPCAILAPDSCDSHSVREACPTSCGICVGGDITRTSVVRSPHSMCEAMNGTIMVQLQNSPEIVEYGSWYDRDRRANPGTPAVWHIHPDKYDPSKYARGGVLYKAMSNPVNCAPDGTGQRVLIAQDSSRSVLRVDTSGDVVQIETPRMLNTGPGMVAAPDGSVWVACHRCVGALVTRFRPGSDEPEYYSLLDNATTFIEAQKKSRRVIHFAFHTTRERMFALTTSLGVGLAAEEIIAVSFSPGWGYIMGEYTEVLPLGAYAEAHRIAFVPHPMRNSLVVTNWGTDTVIQVSGLKELDDEFITPRSQSKPLFAPICPTEPTKMTTEPMDEMAMAVAEADGQNMYKEVYMEAKAMAGCPV